MLRAAHTSRRLLACALALATVALLGAGRAEAGNGVAPNGQSFTVRVDATGAITSPSSIDLVVRLDAEDSAPFVWVSDSPTVGSAGTPAGRTVAGCSSTSLLPSGEPGTWICRASTVSMQPGRTYYWWLDYDRRDPGAAAPTSQISGPFSFSLVQEAPPVAPVDPHAGASSKTVESAARLPSADRYDGSRSVKHVPLTKLVYTTMKTLGLPRQLAFACWSPADWRSVLAAEGSEPTRGRAVLLGFWLGRQPRWLHLAPEVCKDVQALLTTRRVNARRASALATVIHETLHAYGVRNEAETNCYAVQLVPSFGRALRLGAKRSAYMGKLARNYVRAHSPAGYWNAARCREGGAWDLFEGPNPPS